jgi:choline kinase
MKAIIPAAGRGSRMRPYTDELPKGLISIAGRPLLARTVEQLAEAGIGEVICVTGYLAKTLENYLRAYPRRPAIRFIYNPYFATTNNVVSLALTTELWDQSILILDADILFTADLLSRLLAAPRDALVVDTHRSPDKIDVGVELRGPTIARAGKEIPCTARDGEFVALSKWTRSGAAALANELQQSVASGRTEAWYQEAISAVADKRPIDAVFAGSSEWSEIDTPNDLNEAEKFIDGQSNSTSPPRIARSRYSPC